MSRRDGVNGDPTAMHALATDMSQVAGDARMNVLRVHAHFEKMAIEDTWDDGNHAEYMDRFGQLRSQLERVLEEIEVVALEIHRVADRYHGAK